MSEISQQEEYVRWAKGAEILGIKRNAFFYLIESGQVRAEPGRGPRDGRYSLADILEVKAMRERKKPRKPHKRRRPSVIIEWLLPSDIPAGLKLDQMVYPHEIDLAEAATYQSWRRNNNKLTMGAFSEDRSECFAYLQLVPLEEQVILDILSGKRDENSIKPEEVQGYDRPGAYTLLAISAVAHPDRPDLLYKILYKMTQFWIDQYPERYITRVYAQAVSVRGDMLIQHFFMAPRYDLGPDVYMLDMTRPGTSRMIRWLQSQLQQKASLSEAQQRPGVPLARNASPSPSQPQPEQVQRPLPPPAPDPLRPALSEIQTSTDTEGPFLPLADVAKKLGLPYRRLWRFVVTHGIEHTPEPKRNKKGEQTANYIKLYSPKQQSIIKAKWNEEHPTMQILEATPDTPL